MQILNKIFLGILLTILSCRSVHGQRARGFWLAASQSIDVDAQAFITAASITDPAITNAVNYLVKAYKANGLWNKMIAIYPMIGGSANTCKYNLKDPRDLDIAYRIVFNGTWAYATTGATPNGSTGFGNTNIVPATDIPGNNIGMAYYFRTNTAATPSMYEMGCTQGSGQLLCIAANISNTSYWFSFTTTGAPSYTTNVQVTGLISGNRIANYTYCSRNGVLQSSSTNTTLGSKPTIPIMLGARGTAANAAALYSSRECSYADVNTGLTVTEDSIRYSIVQQFQILK